MGLFDSIGLGSVAKMLDVGGIVKNVVDGVLPKNLASVGDLAGAVVDFKTGNVAAAVQHALDSVRDLPQVARGTQPGARNSPNLTRMPAPWEPPPPPLASRQGKVFDWNDLLAAVKALTAALNRQGTPGTAAAPGPAGGSATATPTSTASANSAPASGSSTRTQSGREAALDWAHANGGATWWGAGHTAAGWRGQPMAAAPAASNRAGATGTAPAGNTAANPTVPASTTTSAPKPETPASAGIATTPSSPSASQTNSGKTDSGKTSTGQTISSIAQLNGMSDAAIRDAVINGRISPDVLKDQGSMMVLQQRMQAIAEMNNLMTSMMRALHDMQMAVIQNIRI